MKIILSESSRNSSPIYWLLAVAALLTFSGSAFAQSVSLTGPLGNQTFKAGDDFFTDRLDLPADGTERRMIGWEENFVGSSVGVSGGVWRGENASPGGYVFPLFPSLKGTLTADALPGDRKLPKLGIDYPVDTNKYTRLSYRLNNTSRSTHAVYWENDANKSQYWPDPNSPRGASYDGFYHFDGGYTHNGFFIYDYDLTNLAGEFEQTQGSWSGNVIALRLDPSVGGPAGAVTEIDWVRLVDPNSAPFISLTWDSSGLSLQSVITVYHDTNASGYDGTPIARFGSGNDPGSYSFPSATLPPGDHYFYVEVQNASSGSFQGGVSRSGYSGRTSIQEKPRVFITAPSPSSGEDYATAELNDPWDMNSATDVPNITPDLPQVWRQFTNESFPANADAQEGSNIFQALAEPPYKNIGNQESDVQVHMRVAPSTPIDTSHYRYVVYRMAIDETQYPTIHNKVENGWVSRIVAWNNDVINDAVQTSAHVVYEGWNTYWFDMLNDGITEAGKPWSSFFRIKNFRLDPGEFNIDGVNTWFYLDYLKLVGENRTPGGFFDIKYNLEDKDSSSLSVKLFYDTDKSGFNGTLIADLGSQGTGSHTHRWNTSGLADQQRYYVYAEVSDGSNISRAYSPVHVKIGAYAPSKPEPRSGIRIADYDGDGASDQVVYRPSTGTYFFNRSAAGYASYNWGNRSFKPIQGDFDGDGITDRGLSTVLGGQYYHYVEYSSNGATYARAWGLNGDIVVVGDYNGNDRDELAVWRPAEGNWYILDESDNVRVQQWGLFGDIPVPADFDGDQKTDTAIFRPATGTWWVLNSGFEAGLAENFFTAQQWGLPGDVPMVGDWDTNGNADFMVWRPSDGNWYLRNAVSGEVSITQWGFGPFGDIPRVGDYNNDGQLDLSVFRNGMWFHNYRNGLVGAIQFGLPGDLLPAMVGPIG